MDGLSTDCDTHSYAGDFEFLFHGTHLRLVISRHFLTLAIIAAGMMYLQRKGRTERDFLEDACTLRYLRYPREPTQHSTVVPTERSRESWDELLPAICTSGREQSGFTQPRLNDTRRHHHTCTAHLAEWTPERSPFYHLRCRFRWPVHMCISG